MRNFANYDVDIHGKSSGVLKTICKNVFLPARISATVRYVSTSTRATVTVIIVALIFMFPMMWKSARMPNVWQPASVVQQPFRSIFSVQCLMPRKPRFPKTRSVGWWRRVASRSPS